MRTISIPTLAVGTLALFTVAGAAAAQAPSPILNALEVQKLVASSEPADNARLSAHFAALADQYATDARRHTAMAQAFTAAPTRRTPTHSAADHCKRLATLNTQSSETLRELAARRPGTLTELLDIPGIGERKAEVYGPAILAVLASA